MKISPRILSLITAGGLVLAGVVGAAVGLVGNSNNAHAASAFPNEYFAPYDDVTIGASLQTVTQTTGQKYYTLAFISGNGCNADWAGTIPLNETSTYLPNLDSDISYIRGQGGDIIISFGGEAGQELAQTCSNASSLQAQYQAVVSKYNATHLDFDIEGGEQGDSTTYDRRNIALAALQAANPGLTISFTLPSATTGLLSDSLGLLNNAVSHGVNFNVVNLMTMDYGSPDSQMGQEAINAANGLHSELQNIFPSKSSSQLWSMVGITPMIGQNDSGGEIFSLSNASQVLSFAQTNKIGELSFWEVPRDNGNCAGSTTATDTCSGISQSAYQF
ncbi:MAG TPA: chitinase, partial [Ktedonobacteraceae bacterium]